MLYLAAVLIVASVALFVAAPLGGGLLAGRRIREAAEAERLEHERALAMQGLRELEFDREMGKLADADYAALREGLMTRALSASAALERLRPPLAARPRLVRAVERGAGAEASAGAPTPAATSAQGAPGTPARVSFCAQCGARVAPANFCAECGAALGLAPRAAARAER
ncbi:MAG TPA: hypothetical protein VKT27_13375 [Candidatus Binataceae bacterium]|nr:hypothetical protein [Candidatus Binataceae bacterium]